MYQLIESFNNWLWYINAALTVVVLSAYFLRASSLQWAIVGVALLLAAGGYALSFEAATTLQGEMAGGSATVVRVELGCLGSALAWACLGSQFLSRWLLRVGNGA